MIKAFKAFNKDFQCRDFQFEVGKTYEESEASLCNRGFHACENPLDTLNYYDLCESKFAEVELEATDEKQKDDSKRVGKKISIKAELSLKDFIKASIEYLFDTTKSKEDSGNYAQLASSGNSAQLASSGDYAQLASSGDYAKLASSGDYAKLASSGDSAKLASSGDSAQLASSGDDSVLMCAGHNGKAKAKKGSWITLSEWAVKDGKVKPIFVKTEQVDGERIKEDVYYRLENGQFVEVE